MRSCRHCLGGFVMPRDPRVMPSKECEACDGTGLASTRDREDFRREERSRWRNRASAGMVKDDHGQYVTSLR